MLIELSEYDPKWPAKFEQEKEFLLELIGDWCVGSVEHVGSTAVPGLAAKPIIDMMFGVESLEASKPVIELLKDHYCYAPYKTEVMHWFCKPSPEFRTHHLHLVPYQSKLWLERIGFRDALRENPQTAAEYAKLKSDLAVRYKQYREAYTQAKWPFIKKVLQPASEEG